MKSRHLCLILPLLLLPATFGCINTPETESKGKRVLTESPLDAKRLQDAMALTSPKSTRPRPSSPPTTPAKKLEAKALDLIFAGKFSEALPLLQQAAKIGPIDYSIAANLGTTYELTGDNAHALQWIQEAIRLNPDSHQGTEWVHVLVLKAKLRAAATSSGLSEPLVSLPQSFTESTLIKVDGVTRPVEEVRRAIYYQLAERMVYVKPKDVYVADLLFTLALLSTNFTTLDLLKLAEAYGYADTQRIQKLRQSADPFWSAESPAR